VSRSAFPDGQLSARALLMITTQNARPEEQLLSAVVALAIEDACLPPTRSLDKKTLVMNRHAFTAYRFLFTHSDPYLELLNIDPKSFRERILVQLQDLTHNRPFNVSNRPDDIISRRKRMFKMNHHLYHQKGMKDSFVEDEDE
jgi:hypothetical protein